MTKIKSMTGFAAIQTPYNDNELTCEIRSLNSRYLEISVKLPKLLSDLENSIKDLIRKKIERGKVFCSINFSTASGELQNLKIDEGTVKLYLNLLNQIKTVSGIQSPIGMEHLLLFKDIISFEENSKIDDELTQSVLDTVEKAVQSLNNMRSEEGKNLIEDLNNRIEKITLLTTQIENLAEDNVKIEFDRLYKRLSSLIDEEKIEPNRLEQEVALIADRVDITEELVRMKSHLKLFRKNLDAGSPVGKKLNFILQEMHRETNTISNKNTIVEIGHKIVAIKEEIEKLREQIQNIE